jgi:DNA-binding transcriptional MocR family regulator
MGLPDRRLLPPLAPVLARLGDIDALPNRYAPRNDPSLLRIAAEQFSADGVPNDRMTVLGGALDGIERALEAQLALGDRVAVEDPGYPPVADLLRAHGLRPVPFGVDDEGPLPDQLADALTHGTRGVILTPRAQNPTGAAVTPERAKQIREVLDDREVLVIEDDHAGAIAGARYVPVAPLVGGHWVVIRSVTKSLSPDLRLSVVAGDPATIDRIEGRHALGSGWISTILQRCVASLWSDPATAKLLVRAEDSYRERRAAVLDALARRGLPASGSSGLNVWVPVRRESSTVEGLLAAGWATTPGDRFRFRSGPAVRVTVSGLDLGDVEPLADAFVAAVGVREPAY